MNKKVKKDLVPLFNVLRSLVDARAPKLQRRIDAGGEAARRIPQVQAHIASLQQYADNVRRFDPADARDTERDISDQEDVLVELHRTSDDGIVAQSHMDAANRFYKVYNKVVQIPQIAALREEYQYLSNRQSMLIDKMDAYQFTLNPDYRSAKLCEDFSNDNEYLMNEYEQVSKRMEIIHAQISALERQR